MNNEPENNDPDFSPEVVYLSEYGAAVPAWVELDTKRWMSQHWLYPMLLMAGAGVATFLMLTAASGFFWVLALCGFLTWRYWNGVRHGFRHGNANAGRVVSMKPPLVAVFTDLDNSGEANDEMPSHPAVKILPYPLKSVLGQPLEVGLPVPTAATYVEGGEGNTWKDFRPLFLEEGSSDFDTLHGVLARVPEAEWEYLDAAVDQLAAAGRLKVGLWRLG